MTDAAILQIFATVYLAVGIGGLVDKRMIGGLVHDFEKDRAISYLSGLVAVIIGYLIVSTRVESSAVPAVLVTVLGWIALVKGFCIIAFPRWSFAMASSFTKSKAVAWAFPYYALALSAIAFSVSRFA